VAPALATMMSAGWNGPHEPSPCWTEAALDFDGGDVALGAGEFSEDRGVVTGSATEMEHHLAGLDVEVIEYDGPEAGLAVVDAFRLVEGDERVVIDVLWIGVLSCPVAIEPKDPPGAGPDEPRAGNGGEGLKQSVGRHAGEDAQILGVNAACGFERGVHRGSA